MIEIPSFAVKITDIIEETPSIKTFVFDREFEFSAGQFCMIWVPGVDEIPMGLSSGNAITVQKVGEATSALFSLDIGDTIGIKAPLGNGFSLGKKVLAIGGGVGAAPLRPLALKKQCDTFLLGSRNSTEILYENELSSITDLHIATDDGSFGHHGFVTELMQNIDLLSYDTVCVCGPEIMMANVLRVLQTNNIAERGQFSLVRYMKCGVGICGSCCLDNSGLRVCKDGPVFTGDVLLESKEFGKYSRDASGRRVSSCGGH
ncbi:MAG: dihydroorotate dehydrogenase electron transfer subunit [Methanomicrobiaceae archaeon]|nr:dihydroorotate dehydrogenase electron transfer subunit [Methanomicrobiaceae archaeon]